MLSCIIEFFSALCNHKNCLKGKLTFKKEISKYQFEKDSSQDHLVEGVGLKVLKGIFEATKIWVRKFF